MKNTQKGFIVPLLIVILAVVAVGAGFYFYNQNKESNQISTATNTSTTTTTQATPTTQTTSTQNLGTNTSTSNKITVAGMTEYTDTNFGFSFWYPTSWQVQDADPIQKSYGSGIVQKAIKIGNGAGYITIEEIYSADTSVYVGSDYSGYDTYYFDTSTHTWMNSIHNAPTAVPDKTIAADVSKNTMGGLHMFFGGARFGLSTLIPLSAEKFLMITGNFDFDQTLLAKTVLALDPSVATPVSISQQVQTIQTEAKAYNVSTQPITTSLKTYTNSQYGFSLTYPTDIQINTTSKLQQSYEANINAGTQILVVGPVSVTASGFPTGTMVVSVSTNSNDIAHCVTAPKAIEIGPANISTKSINGVNFLSYDVVQPAAGQLGLDHTYSTLYNGVCYSIDSHIDGTESSHLTGTDAATNDAANAQLSAKLDTIAQSFKF